MKRYSHLFVLAVSYFFMLLFVYASISKILDFNNFQVQLSQSPIVSAYADIISYIVLTAELVISGLLIFQTTRLLGLYLSMGMMVSFTVYIYIILNYSEFIPCSCGGILEKLGWTEHLIFNIVCILLALTSIIILEKLRKNKPVKYLSTITLGSIFSILMVVILYHSSEYIIKKENNFTRKFMPHAIDFPVTVNLKSNSFYFSGSFSDQIFLGNVTAPLVMGKLDPKFKTLILDTLDLDKKDLSFSAIRLQVDYPDYSISDGKVPAIYEGQFPQKTARLIPENKIFFSQILMVAPQQYIFRTHHRIKDENMIGRIQFHNKDEKPDVALNDRILEKQIDGVFDTDGQLVKDQSTGEFVYTYYYRNEYRRMDRDLKFLGSGRTIDSTYKAQIKITKTKSGQIKMGKPPLKVNRLQFAANGLLFNLAGLRGKHESENIWKKSSIIDVYDYRKNEYLYSFPVNHHNSEPLRDFLVTDDFFYVLAGNDIIKYKRMHKPAEKRKGKAEDL